LLRLRRERGRAGPRRLAGHGPATAAGALAKPAHPLGPRTDSPPAAGPCARGVDSPGRGAGGGAGRRGTPTPPGDGTALNSCPMRGITLERRRLACRERCTRSGPRTSRAAPGVRGSRGLAAAAPAGCRYRC
jgi:hypothetical protein